MRPLPSRPRLAAFLVTTGLLGSMPLLAQTDLPAMRTSGSRPTLERPPVYDIPSTSTTSTRSSSSSSRSTAKTGGIPDTSIFDGSAYPPEKRPEQGLIAQFEMPGQEQPSDMNVEGDGEKQGGGGQGQGGNDSMSSGGGPQMGVAGGMPGLQIPGMMGGGGGDDGQEIAAIPTLDTGDRGKEGSAQGEGAEGDSRGQSSDQGSEGEPGQPGGEAGAPSDQEAPKLAGRQGRQLEKPNQVQIGDEGAKLAASDVPVADASRSLDGTQQGEDRMAVKAAAGQQTANRGSGTERGVDIPSNL